MCYVQRIAAKANALNATRFSPVAETRRDMKFYYWRSRIINRSVANTTSVLQILTLINFTTSPSSDLLQSFPILFYNVTLTGSIHTSELQLLSVITLPSLLNRHARVLSCCVAQQTRKGLELLPNARIQRTFWMFYVTWWCLNDMRTK